MTWTLIKGGAVCSHSGQSARLTLQVVTPNGGKSSPLERVPEQDAFLASHKNCQVKLKLVEETQSAAGRVRFLLSVQALVDIRIELRLELLDHPRDAWHILPGFLFGDNNLSIAEAGHFPNLSRASVANQTVSPTWQMRVDRNAAPLAMAFGDTGGHIAIAAPPYSDLEQGHFIKNGLIAELPATVGFAVGYRNAPLTFINKDTFGDPTEHVIPAGTTLELPVDIFFKGDTSRNVSRDLLREVYALYHVKPEAKIDAASCIDAIPEAAIADAWFDEQSVFKAVQVKGLPEEAQYRHIGGRAIAWVGGVNVCYPLLMAGALRNRPEWMAIAHRGFERVAANVNPATGLFFDAYTEDWAPSVNYWWSGNTNRDLHSAYTNAEAACYLLRGSLFEKERTGESVASWHQPALTACDVILSLQRKDGHCGYAYYSDHPEVASWDGFAGCWWAVAFCEAYRLTGAVRYLDAARRAVACYWPQVQSLNVWGTPMDTWKSNDEEGVLAFVQATRRLHALTGKDQYLEMLAAGADYEFLWRFLYNVRPDAEPLKSAGWHSCGGSITSVSNPHVHPMALLIAGDLKYLADRTGDSHVQMRLEDSLVWARNCLELFPNRTGYGQFGWTGERYCHSDGLLIARYKDGTPSSTEFEFNLWAASAMLEGFLETDRSHS